MSLHGEIKVNHNIIGDWSAQRAGTTGDGDFIYRCKVNYRDMAGYTHFRYFFLRHNFYDGALALTGKVMLESDKQMEQPEMSETTAWHNFCDEHNLNPYEALGQHITLKE